MTGYVARRLIALLPILFLMTLVIFVVLRMTPGDPARAMVGQEADAAAYEQARRELGLDQPLPLQYVDWVLDAVRGDLGVSHRSNQPVTSLIGDRLPVTFQLTVMSLFLAVLISLPLGTIAGAKRNSAIDRMASAFAACGIAIPGFWLGLLLLTFFATNLGWFPAFGYTSLADNPLRSLQSLTLPAIAVALPPGAILTRMVRSSVVEVISQDYVRTARAKGLADYTVVVRHVLRNSLIPVATILGLVVGSMLSGAIIIEVVFALPGLGRLAVDSILFRELAVVQGIVMLIAVFTVSINLLVDLSYGLLDPRVRLGE